VFVEGTAGIDSFERRGVELGKAPAIELAPMLTSATPSDVDGPDSSTAALVRRYRARRGRPV